jgi:hypothetical protein
LQASITIINLTTESGAKRRFESSLEGAAEGACDRFLQRFLERPLSLFRRSDAERSELLPNFRGKQVGRPGRREFKSDGDLFKSHLKEFSPDLALQVLECRASEEGRGHFDVNRSALDAEMPNHLKFNE